MYGKSLLDSSVRRGIADSGGQFFLAVEAEVRKTWTLDDTQTFVNLSLHWKLSEDISLLAAGGRNFGPHKNDQQ
ncbi:hypothetical protein [Azoarcus sp. KH32C]|uniref:hypothetical protein n=1 Tax=Azoarcus sp. KH32C TaxID=748247 RepID=UPI0003457988|nr:hypothetical protein [Azoarcus sp. KH32C]